MKNSAFLMGSDLLLLCLTTNNCKMNCNFNIGKSNSNQIMFANLFSTQDHNFPLSLSLSVFIHWTFKVYITEWGSCAYIYTVYNSHRNTFTHPAVSPPSALSVSHSHGSAWFSYCDISRKQSASMEQSAGLVEQDPPPNSSFRPHFV